MIKLKSFFENKMEMLDDFSKDEEFMEHFSSFKELIAKQGEDAQLMILFSLIIQELVEGEIEEEHDLLNRVAFLENDLKKIKKIVKRLKW